MPDAPRREVPWSPRGFLPDTGGRSRLRFRSINLAMILPLLLLVGAVLVVRESQTWPDAVGLGLGLVVIVVAYERWTAGAIGSVALPCLVVAAAVWPYGAWVVAGPVEGGYYALAVVAALVVPQLGRHRVIAGALVVGYVAAVGLVAMIGEPEFTGSRLLALVIMPTGMTAILVGLMIPNKGFYDKVAEIERAQEREAELAVVRERMRFASDLHDIQGHTLHVVKLKVALAQRLLHTDVGRVEQELSEIHALVGDTIGQAKELAYGQRRLNLAAEVENARNLFEAAGVDVRVETDGALQGPHVELLGQILRETTTNILRHAEAALVRIAVTEHSLVVVNDGVHVTELPSLRGLAVLASRVEQAGGVLKVDLEGGRFRTEARFPAPSEATR